MAKHRRYPGHQAFGYQQGYPYQNYAPYWENHFNYMPPIYGPNYPVDQHSYYYPSQQLAPPHYPQPWSYPNQLYPVQPPHYIPQGQYMPVQQQYPPRQFNSPTGRNQSRRHRPEMAPYYVQTRPEEIAQPAVTPPNQVNPKSYQTNAKKAGRNSLPPSKSHPKQNESVRESPDHPEPPHTSQGQPAPDSNKPNYKNWQNYKRNK